MDHPSTLINTTKLIQLTSEPLLIFTHDPVPYNVSLHIENLSSDIARVGTGFGNLSDDYDSITHYKDIPPNIIDSVLLTKDNLITIYAKGCGTIRLTLIYLVKQQSEQFVSV